MPYFEPSRSARGRFRVASRAQLPLVLCALFFFVETLIAAPESFEMPLLLPGFAIIGAASIAALALPWERWPSDYLVIVALTDVFAVSLVRLELFAVIPSAGLMAIFPLIWLAYGFRRWAMWLAVVASVTVTALPLLIRGELPATALGWVGTISFPVVLIVLAVAVGAAARTLERSRVDAAGVSHQLRESYQGVDDQEVVSRTILETIDTAVALYDPSGRLVAGNRRAWKNAAASGFALDVPPFSGPRVLGDDRVTVIPALDQTIPRALRGEFVSERLEWIGPPDDQSAMLVTSLSVTQDDGPALGTLVASHDVTRLVEAVAVREHFLLTVSHELRTPLTSVIGYLELLRDAREDGDDDMQEKALEVIERSSGQLLERITELLSVGDERMRLELGDCDVEALCAQVVEHMLPRAAEQAVGLAFVPSGRPSVEARVDARRLRQVVENLISNAIKFTPREGVISVDVSVALGDTVIAVRDSGIGMTREEQRQAFDRFYRASSSHFGAVQGIGLGLSFAQNVVQAHGGTILLSGSPDHGTTAVVRIPAGSRALS